MPPLLGFKRAEVGEQFLRVVQGNFARRFEPAELAQILHAGSLEREHDIGKVEALDFGQLVRRAFVVFRL